MAGVFKAEHFLFTIQHRSDPLCNRSSFFGTFPVGRFTNMEVVLPDKKVGCIQSIGGSKPLPCVIHREDDAVVVQQGDMGRQGVEDADHLAHRNILFELAMQILV